MYQTKNGSYTLYVSPLARYNIGGPNRVHLEVDFIKLNAEAVNAAVEADVSVSHIQMAADEDVRLRIHHL